MHDLRESLSERVVGARGRCMLCPPIRQLIADGWRDTVKKMLKTVLLVLCFVGCAGVRQAMALTNIFMFFPGIPGEVVDDPHQGWIDVTSYAQNLAQGNKQNKIACFVVVSHHVDKASPLLYQATAIGHVFPEILIDLTKQDGDQRVFYRFTLQNVVITSVRHAADLDEFITLSPRSVQLEFFPLITDGTLGGPSTSSFQC
jgi:type VI protein secretion system component Hcp